MHARTCTAGGITPETAGRYLEAGASHVIVTSYLFQGAAVRLIDETFICLRGWVESMVEVFEEGAVGPRSSLRSLLFSTPPSSFSLVSPQLDFGRLEALSKAVGKDRLVRVVSCPDRHRLPSCTHPDVPIYARTNSQTGGGPLLPAQGGGRSGGPLLRGEGQVADLHGLCRQVDYVFE